MYGTVDASARRQASAIQFVHVERDIKLLVHGDDFMVEMLTHEEQWYARGITIQMAPP